MRTSSYLFLAAFALEGCGSDSGFAPSSGGLVVPLDTGDTGAQPLTSDAPIAVCEASKDEVQPPFETVRFNGSASHDPNALPIVAYEWTLVSTPDGNSTALSTRIGSQTTFTPQLAGTYVIELSVVNELGIRSAENCKLGIIVTPSQGLWVEMFWSHSGEDMDLHVLAPNGTPRSGADCFFANCRYGRDWGTLGDDSDDPILDIDDIAGVGPENINIEVPESGTYTVFVHDFPSTGVRPEPTEVTVNIYLGPERVFNATRTITGENADEYFATVNPVTGLVTPL